MSLKQAIVIAVALVISYAGGVVMGKTETEKFELEGNMKFFGVGSGIIFTDGTKQTSAGVGSSNDVTCASTCVGFGEIATSAVGTNEIINRSILSEDLALNSVTSLEIAVGAVGTAEVANNSLTFDDLATSSVNSLEIAADAVGSSEIAPSAVGTSEVADNSLTDDDLAPNSVGTSEIASNAVTGSNVLDKTLQLNDLAMTVVMNQTIDLDDNLNNGECSDFTPILATGAPTNSFALPFGVKLASNGTNPGWTMEGENSPTNFVDSVKVRVCNQTGGTAQAPNLRFNFWSIAQ